MPQEIFASDFRIDARDVFILASGPGAVYTFDDNFTHDDTTIGVNNTAIWPVFPDIHVVADPKVLTRAYWDSCKCTPSIRIFSAEVHDAGAACNYIFHGEPRFTSADTFPKRGLLRHCNVAATALQLAHWFAPMAARIYLLGVTMRGGHHEGGTCDWRGEDTIWNERDLVDGLIMILKQQGREIYSLTETALQCVEVLKERK